MKYLDIHCHLAKNYFWRQMDTLMKEWAGIGLSKIGAMATNIKSSKRNLELADKFPDKIVAAVGRHPWGAHKFTDKDKTFYQEIIADPRVQIIGEIGLDYYFIKEKEKYPQQITMLEFFLKLAEKHNKPVMIHCTGAEQALSEILSSFNLGVPVCCHWYSGPAKPLKVLADMGCFFSINPVIVESRGHQRVLKVVDNNYLLTESDGDVKFQGEPGSPALMPFLYKKLAEKLTVPPEQLATRLLENLNRFLQRD
ncbi:MAG: hypothetical protein GF308_05170 [Candidatus Heimdallarchaeota archaeon]|nr:hypothetical protein [Candidatus Heimdallarchaeota archaeon]